MFTYPLQLNYFEQNLEKIYTKYNKTMICWEELALEHPLVKLPRDTIVNVWKDGKAMLQSTKLGYQTLLSAGWYLNRLTPNGKCDQHLITSKPIIIIILQ